MAKIYIDNNKLSTFHTILNHWANGETEPHFINIMCAIRGWSPISEDETVEIYYGNEIYIIKRKN